MGYSNSLVGVGAVRSCGVVNRLLDRNMFRHWAVAGLQRLHLQVCLFVV